MGRGSHLFYTSDPWSESWGKAPGISTAQPLHLWTKKHRAVCFRGPEKRCFINILRFPEVLGWLLLHTGKPLVRFILFSTLWPGGVCLCSQDQPSSLPLDSSAVVLGFLSSPSPCRTRVFTFPGADVLLWWISQQWPRWASSIWTWAPGFASPGPSQPAASKAV